MKNSNFWFLASLGLMGFGIKRLIQEKRAFNLRGKVILVTGGSRGLGLVLCRYLAKAGAKLAICARNKEEVKRGCENLAADGIEASGFVCDVTDPDQVKILIAKIEKNIGPIDVLINNAGVIKVGPFDCMLHEDYEEGMNTHFYGPLNLILQVLPAMRKRGVGRIVNISSIGGKISVPHLLPYSASKFALVGLSEGLRNELAKDGIIVTTVCPGLMRTGSFPNASFKGQHEKEYGWFAISSTLPGISVSAERAARQIIRGIRYGEGQVIITLVAKLAIRFNALFPNLTSTFMSLTNRLLPESDENGTSSKKGKEIGSQFPYSLIRKLNEKTIIRNNEL